MSWNDLVLGQSTIYRAPKRRRSNRFAYVPEDVIYHEIGANPISNRPSMYFSSESHDFPGHVGAGKDVFFEL